MQVVFQHRRFVTPLVGLAMRLRVALHTTRVPA
jgi:hypothetical protein